MKRFAAFFFIILLIPLASASQITSESTNIKLAMNGPANVTVERHYASITQPHISYFVPAHYDPQQLVARDDLGRLDCTVRTFDSGKEILCDPRKMDDYKVDIHFLGSFVNHDRRSNQYDFSYVKQVLTPTKQTDLQVVLPEGFGLVKSKDESAYLPGFGTVGSEGRRIFIHWTRNNVSIGDTTQYTVRYEKLQALDKLSVRLELGILLLAILLSAGAVYYVLNNRQENPDTIAAVFPVLKEDEQLVLRYIIDNDGEVEQRDIVENVSYSKAKISKLLSDLEERHLVEKEKQGRVNIVKLVKEVGDLAPTAQQ